MAFAAVVPQVAAAILLRQAWIAVCGAAVDSEGDMRAMLDVMHVVDPFHAAADTVKLLAQESDDGAEQTLATRGSIEKRALIVASTEALRTALHRHEV